MIIILNYRDKQNSESVSSLITVWSDTLQLISDFENDLVITDFIFQENELYCLCHNKLKIFKLQNSKPKLNQVVDLDNLGTGLETSIGTKLMHWVAFSDWLMGFELERHLINSNNQNLIKMVDYDFTMISCALLIVNEFDFLSFFVSIKHFIWNRNYVIIVKSQLQFSL